MYKLRALGLDDHSVNWMSSYLTGRAQVVDIDGTLSSTSQISCGVPQGSILGPLLFLVYINDMPSAVNCKLLLYADDSALVVSGTSVSDIEATLSLELESVSQWLMDNKLSLHLGKTESILFGNNHLLSKCSELNVRCNDSTIEPKSSVKYLGVQLDQRLNGECMASSVIKKVSARVKFLLRKSKYLDFYTSKLLASALVQCHLDYGCCVWYSSITKKTKNQIQICQNKLIRCVLKLSSRCHLTIDHFKRLNWLPVEDRVIHLKLCYVKRIVSGQAPTYLSSGLNYTSQTHSHVTRSSHTGFVVPRVRTMMGKNTFLYTSIKEWNALPVTLQNSTSIIAFKNEVKVFLFSKLAARTSSNFVYF